MYNQLFKAINSLSFISELANKKKIVLQDIVVEINNCATMDDLMLVKNILLLLHSAHKLELLNKVITIGDIVKVYKFDETYDSKDDAVDALRYAVEVKKETYDNIINKAQKTIQKIKEEPEVEILEDLVFPEPKIEDIEEEEPVVEKPVKHVKLPDGFAEDAKKYTTDQLTNIYHRSPSTIRKWKRELSKQV